MTVTVETKDCNYHFSVDSDSMGIRIQFEKKLDNGVRQITSYGTFFEDGNIALFSKWWMVENDYKNEQEFFEKHFQNKFNYEGFYYLCLRKDLVMLIRLKKSPMIGFLNVFPTNHIGKILLKNSFMKKWSKNTVKKRYSKVKISLDFP